MNSWQIWLWATWAPFGWQWIVVRCDTGRNAGLGARQVGNTASDFQRLTTQLQQSIPLTTKPSLSPCGQLSSWVWWLKKRGVWNMPLLNRLPLHHNYLYVKRHHPEKLDAHVPEFAKQDCQSVSIATILKRSLQTEGGGRWNFPPCLPLLPTAWGHASSQGTEKLAEWRVLPLSQGWDWFP